MVGKKILIVDDMPIVSQGTALMLESIGYDADQAASGAAAIELFKSTEYGTGIAKLSPGATQSCKALPGKCFRIWKFLRCFANTVELSQTGNFLIA